MILNLKWKYEVETDFGLFRFSKAAAAIFLFNWCIVIKDNPVCCILGKHRFDTDWNSAGSKTAKISCWALKKKFGIFKTKFQILQMKGYI